MGYNNNHAGMHMINWRKVNYDNLEYYDNLAASQYKPKKKKNNNTNKSNKKTNNKETNNNNNIQNQSSEYEYLISSNDAIFPFEVQTNIFVTAFLNKIDVVEKIKKIEDIMSKDRTINEKYENDRLNGTLKFPKLYSPIVFLSLLAKELNCNVSDFFVVDIDKRKQLLDFIISNLRYYDWAIDFYDEDIIEFPSICFHEKIGLPVHVPVGYLQDTDNNELWIRREKMDGYYEYSLCYGNMWFDPNKQHYLFYGADLWIETDGDLEKYVENIISEYK